MIKIRKSHFVFKEIKLSGTIPEDKLADLRIDLDDLDQELRKVWDGLEAQVRDGV